MGDALDGVLDGMREVVQRIDAPLVALAVVVCAHDAVDGRVAHVHVGAGQVDLGAQGLAAVGELAGAHAAEQVEVLLGGAVAVGAGTAGLAGVLAAVGLHLLAGQVVHIRLALFDQQLGVFIALVEIVAAVVHAAVGDGAQPLQILLDAVDILHILVGGVGVVKAQVELAAVLLGDGVVDVDGLRAADVQIAVGLGREAGVDLFHLSLGQVGLDDLGQEIAHTFFHDLLLLQTQNLFHKSRRPQHGRPDLLHTV